MPESLLIVDDEKNTRDGLRVALEDSFEVYVAADIAGALATIEDAGIDVVVTDLRLGGESGMDLLEKALMREREHEADKRRQRQQIPMSPNERDW